MKTLQIVLIIIAISQLGLAQVPTLSVHRESGSESLEISELNINVEILGNIATTTFDIVFFNPYNRILEGELSMPLKNGQEICRYALDINGKLREGVIVEKIKARQTFEAVVRQQIDPGIINRTKGNSFKTKIYPVPAKGSKRVVLAFVETLFGDAENLHYLLPLENMQEVKQFSLNVKAIKSGLKSKKISSGFQNIEFDNQDDAYVFHLERDNFTTNEPLNFTVPRFSEDKYQLFTCDYDGETYFYLNMKPDELGIKKKASPKNIAIFWDNSFSTTKRKIAAELNLLHSYLNTLNSKVNISVTVFNQNVSELKNFTSANEVISYIKSFENDGATLFENIKLPNNVDEIFLFSDGVNTIGKDELLLTKTPIYAITSSAGSNYSFLKHICAETNGEFIDLGVVSNDRALRLLMYDEEKFLSYDYDSGLIKEIYPKVSKRVDDYFEVAGILIGNEAELKVNFGGKSGITQTKSFTITKKTGSETIARLWAAKKIAALNSNYEQNKNDILILSQKHNIITKNTSLLVLDRVEDYVFHKITPPSELLDEYNRLLTLSKDSEPEKPSVDVIEKRNTNRFKKLEQWYERPLQPNTKKQSESVSEALSGSVSGLAEEEEIIPVTRQEAVTPPPPPPPPNVSESLNIVDDDVELEEELVIEDPEATEEMELDFSNMESEEEGEDVLFMVTSSASHYTTPKSSIKVLSWIPDAPYIKELRVAKDEELLPLYYKLKDENISRPAFYIQVSDLFFSKGRKSEAIRILSNAIELDLENPELLKVVARRLLDEGEYELAIKIFLEIKDLRPEEPQSFRDLAMAYNENKEYNKALDMYLYILDNEWGRFEEIKDVVFNELNCLVALYGDYLDLTKVSKDYIKSMPLDVRITIDWSSNESDIDLWVIDPNGEKCFYKNTHTRIGGKITTDFTQGYGPEEFSLKNAKRGFYTVYVNYYSESRQTITGPVTVYAELTTHYGTEKQETERIAVQLENDNYKKTMQIGQLEFKE
ncbi:uncharacterized protein DUF2135 [Marinilabilia salmonicolor]|jgi:tetratricopeptide (TPR) repeat protein|uniref:VIT domain-containing protein n=1 Tax=Marinilabilia salmonicolor TaxID=989 RepID=UPI000D04C5D0|nr:VIT domain-containing protein [Marinilabilia salmonicolor]PRY99933.1 uncharacterized protein DUF2135 [Marinilabilia salmonicolor]